MKFRVYPRSRKQKRINANSKMQLYINAITQYEAQNCNIPLGYYEFVNK